MTVETKSWKRIEGFLQREPFEGIDRDDLFIKNFIKKGWGQDIAALSNMAEAILLRLRSEKLSSATAATLVKIIVQRAIHRTVSPYRKEIGRIQDLGLHGYYLEHLNIILGCAAELGVHDYKELNIRVSEHLRQQSMTQDNAHAPLMPRVKMRWSADQAAILHSLWLCDKNYRTDFCAEPSARWLEVMANDMRHRDTGLFLTEAMGIKTYSREPRGCALAYLIHYTSRFAPDIAKQQWSLFKRHM